MTDLRLDLLRSILDSYQAEAAARSSHWRDLDQKAQVTATLAGVLTTTVTALTGLHSVGIMSSFWRFCLVGAIVAFMVALAFCLLALLVRFAPAGPVGADRESMTQDLLAVPDEQELRDRLPRFLSDQGAAWRLSSDHIGRTLDRKAALVLGAQLSLFVALLLLAFVGVSTLLR